MAATATKLGDRRDARRNRARIVAAAREVFSSAGADAPAREIARRADVGVATLYRHFPARADLVDAVLEEAFEELDPRSPRRRSPSPTPGRASSGSSTRRSSCTPRTGL